MYKTKELLETIAQHPDHELIFMYPEEGSDHFYTLGLASKIYVDEYTTLDDRVWLRNNEGDDLRDTLTDEIAWDLFPGPKSLSTEQESMIDREVDERITALKWTKCICVYIVAG